jgi:hypothetical protein
MMAQTTQNGAQNAGDVTLEQVLTLAQKLRPVDQARLVVRLAPRVEQFLNQVEEIEAPQPRQSLRGWFADLGPAPSTEDIDEVRREMWATLDRD